MKSFQVLQNHMKSADPCLPGGARPEAVSQSKKHIEQTHAHAHTSTTHATTTQHTAAPFVTHSILSWPGLAVSSFSEGAFWEAFLGEKSWLCRVGAQTQHKVHLEANSRCELKPKAAKPSPFYRFWTQRLTLKITPTQVKNRCP